MTNLEIDWAWGGMMTVAGMGVVFGLLVLLWALLWIIGKVDAAAALRASRVAAERAEGRRQAQPADSPVSVSGSGASGAGTPGASGRSVTVTGADGLDDDTIAAIAVAVIKHADIRRKQAAPEMRTNAPGSHLWASRWLAVGRTLQNTPWRRS